MTDADADGPPPARDARVIGDLVARERRARAPAIRSFGGATERTVTYRDCVATAARAGNFLRHLGVRGPGATADDPSDGAGDGDRADGRSPRVVAVVADPLPEPLFALLGAASIGAVVRFDPDPAPDGARALVVHADDEARYDPPPGTRLAVYGGDPSRPETAHWEAEVWSENPVVPPAGVAPEDPALLADRRYVHGELLSAAGTAVDRLGLAPGDAVAVRASLADPRTVAAGVLAPLLVGGVVVLPDDERRADVAIGPGPEPATVPLADLPPSITD